MFFFINYAAFAKNDTIHTIHALIFGFRLDLIVVAYLVPFLYLICHVIKYRKLQWVFLSIIVLLTSTLAAIDALYFKFLKERISFDFFTQLHPDNNISPWTYVADYWLMALFLIAFSLSFAYWMRPNLPKSNRFNWLTFLLIVVIATLSARGGFRLKPIRTADGGLYVEEDSRVLSFNTSLYLLETWQNPISEPAFIADVNPQLPTVSFASDTLIKPNFVIIVLEGFGKEYTGLNRGMTHTYTPFLNSLMSKSICFHNAYANGLKSVDAVPAIFTGIPKLSNTAFLHSPHSSKPLPSVFNLLAPIGYTSSFFHGADNQTMGFKSYLTTQGLERYYGLDEYPKKEEDHDGHWGIYDQPYLQYVAQQLSTHKQPFVSSVFTLSSHHPYLIPSSKSGSFKDGTIKIHKSIQYTDKALEEFFTSCQELPWFKNTIFIITADHSAENLLHAYRTPSGKYEIPILLYSPTYFQPYNNHKTVSQIDILPTILDIIHYPDTIQVLGESMLVDNTSRSVVHYDNETYHITQNHWSFGRSHDRPSFLYNKKTDINCLENILGEHVDKQEELERELHQQLRNYFYVIKRD